MKSFVFTNISFFTIMCGYMFHFEPFMMIGTCTTFGCLVPFSILPFLDYTGYKRMREKNKWSISFFYMGHFVLHVFPLHFCFLKHHYSYLQYSVLAIFIHMIWSILMSSSKLFCLNDVYVPLEYKYWIVLHVIAFISELSVGLVLSKI